MDLIDVILHASNFTAPAAFVAVFTATAATRLLPKNVTLPRWRSLAVLCFLVNLLVLGAGLVVFGRDGRMATYGAMVAACATLPWALARAWRS